METCSLLLTMMRHLSLLAFLCLSENHLNSQMESFFNILMTSSTLSDATYSVLPQPNWQIQFHSLKKTCQKEIN